MIAYLLRLNTDSQTLASSTILWSASWQHQSWRITALPDGQHRVTASRQNQRGHVQLESCVFLDVSDAWRDLASRWLRDTEQIYNTLETRFRIEIIGYSQGRPGFRQGSPALRKRAEAARDEMFGMARNCGRDWPRLNEVAGAAVASLATPEWLANALDDLGQPSLDIPPLEHWIPHK